MRRMFQIRQDKGLALISVVWVVLLLSVLAIAVLDLSLLARKTTKLELEEAQNQLVAASAVDVFMHRYFLDDEQNARHHASIEVLSKAVTVQVAFEKGRINLNDDNMDYLSAAFAANGVDESAALEIAAAIMDWRDEDDEVSLGGAEEDEYKHSGLDYRPRNGWFESVGELQHVIGVSPDVFLCTQDIFTVYSKVSNAPPVLTYAEESVRKVIKWAYDHDWQSTVWGNPEDIPYFEGASISGDSVAGLAIRLHVTIEGDEDRYYQTVLRLKSKGGTSEQFETVLPVRRISLLQMDALCVGGSS
ncbi:MAG: general secretion pathway protein GspK [Alphaproteobacteria bacterium]|nr:general secretion pathway protein GspK [Alphaproteobacteria bacterium]